MKNYFQKANPPSLESKFSKIFFDFLWDRLWKFMMIALVTFLFFLVLSFWSNGILEAALLRLSLPTGFLKGLPSNFDPPLFIFFLLALALDALIAAVYWYQRLRNPIYILKMENYQRWKSKHDSTKVPAEKD